MYGSVHTHTFEEGWDLNDEFNACRSLNEMQTLNKKLDIIQVVWDLRRVEVLQIKENSNAMKIRHFFDASTLDHWTFFAPQ